MKIYKTYSHHRGDLYEHSMWVEQNLSRWAMGQDKPMDWVQQWMVDFTEREKYLVALAGLLHDIGKAGDPDCSKYALYRNDGDFISYYSKKGHEYTGFTYIMHDIGNAVQFKQGYLKKNGQPFNLKLLFDELHVIDQEQRLIAVLIGSHNLFSELVMKPKTAESNEKILIEKVKKLFCEAGLAPEVTEKILSMIMVMNIADLYSTFFPVEQPGPSLVFGSFILCKLVHDFPEEALLISTKKEQIIGLAPILRVEVLAELKFLF